MIIAKNQYDKLTQIEMDMHMMKAKTVSVDKLQLKEFNNAIMSISIYEK